MKQELISLLFTWMLFIGFSQNSPLNSTISSAASIETNELEYFRFDSKLTPLRIYANELSHKSIIAEKDNPNEELTIYPNPVNVGESWSIKNLPLNSTIEVFNSLGQKIGKSILSTTSVISFDDNLSKGAYIVKIQYNSTVETLKLIIR